MQIHHVGLAVTDQRFGQTLSFNRDLQPNPSASSAFTNSYFGWHTPSSESQRPVQFFFVHPQSEAWLGSSNRRLHRIGSFLRITPERRTLAYTPRSALPNQSRNKWLIVLRCCTQLVYSAKLVVDVGNRSLAFPKSRQDRARRRVERERQHNRRRNQAIHAAGHDYTIRVVSHKGHQNVAKMFRSVSTCRIVCVSRGGIRQLLALTMHP